MAEGQSVAFLAEEKVPSKETKESLRHGCHISEDTASQPSCELVVRVPGKHPTKDMLDISRCVRSFEVVETVRKLSCTVFPRAGHDHEVALMRFGLVAVGVD